MPSKLYALSEAERDLVEKALQKLAKIPEPQDTEPTQPQPGIKADDVYLAYPPCDQSIPAMIGEVPGAMECCIFLLHYGDDPNDPEQREITPILLGKDEDGKPIHMREWVYNIYPVPSDRNRYFQVWRSKGGFFFCERPSGHNQEQDTTTTTTSTTTTTIEPEPQSCEGFCEWQWNDSTRTWNKIDDNCSTTTSTTTTSTTIIGSTTTTTECPCPVEDKSTSTTTTTTLAPPPECNCLWPDFCGTNNGEITYTNCAYDADTDPPICTTTTTTSCNCNTTTTSEVPNCDPACEWVWIPPGRWWPVPGTLQCRNKIHCNPCPQPSTAGGFYCDEDTTNCTIKDDPPPPPQRCNDSCEWWWIPQVQSWIRMTNNCNPALINCYCDPPSDPPSNNNDCVPTHTPCTLHGGGTTTTQDPCHPCYSTTTTTTTGEPSCQAECRWFWNGVTWNLITNDCPTRCPCPDPVWNGTVFGETTTTECSDFPTTSTSSTTTTATPTGACCVPEIKDPFRCLDNITQTSCEDVLGGTYQGDGSTCPADCGPTCDPRPCRWECINGRWIENPQDQCGTFVPCHCKQPPGFPICLDNGSEIWMTCEDGFGSYASTYGGSGTKAIRKVPRIIVTNKIKTPGVLNQDITVTVPAISVQPITVIPPTVLGGGQQVGGS